MKPTNQTKILFAIAIAAAAPAAIAESPTYVNTHVEKKVTEEAGTLTAMIKDSVTFSTLTKALTAAELDVTLGAKGEFTIFAPTDDAFGKLPSGVLTALLLPENKEKLRSLLLYHVVAGKVMSSTLKDGEVKAMNGEKLKIEVGSDKVEVDGSKVFTADVVASNGVMHSLGDVLVPATLKEFVAGLAK